MEQARKREREREIALHRHIALKNLEIRISWPGLMRWTRMGQSHTRGTRMGRGEISELEWAGKSEPITIWNPKVQTSKAAAAV